MTGPVITNAASAQTSRRGNDTLWWQTHKTQAPTAEVAGCSGTGCRCGRTLPARFTRQNYTLCCDKWWRIRRGSQGTFACIGGEVPF